MNFIDTHTHLYLEDFREDLVSIMEEAEIEGVTKFMLPAIDSQVIDAMIRLETEYRGKCFAMMGLHPCSVKENFQQELALVRQWLDLRPFVAIGEIGLDFYWDKTFTNQQYEAFEIQMSWALEKGLPIVIHTRSAMQETIDFVEPFAKKGLKGVFHCFSGSDTDAKRITGLGFYLGIGGVLTYKNSGLANAIREIDLEFIVLETDAPYLAPVPYRGKRNKSSYIPLIAQKLAEVKGLDLEEVALVTTRNAEKIFGI